MHASIHVIFKSDSFLYAYITTQIISLKIIPQSILLIIICMPSTIAEAAVSLRLYNQKVFEIELFCYMGRYSTKMVILHRIHLFYRLIIILLEGVWNDHDRGKCLQNGVR